MGLNTSSVLGGDVDLDAVGSRDGAVALGVGARRVTVMVRMARKVHVIVDGTGKPVLTFPRATHDVC